MNSFHAVLIGCIVVIASTMWYQSPASSDELESLISRVNNSTSEGVKTKLVNFLKETPNPTRKELSTFKNEVEEALVIDLSRQATGDQSLQARVPEPDQHPKEQSLPERVVIWFVLLVLATGCSWAFYSVYKRKKDGQL